MTISNDYLDITSDASTQLLAPLIKKIDEEDLLVLSFEVEVCFERYHHKGWFSQTETLKPDTWIGRVNLFNHAFKDQFLLRHDLLLIGQSLMNSSVVPILNKLAPVIARSNNKDSSMQDDKDRALIAEVCDSIRENLHKNDDMIVWAFVFANLGKDTFEIRKKLETNGDTIDKSKLYNSYCRFKDKIETGSDAELFQEIQCLFPRMLGIVMNGEVETPATLKREEVLKVYNCYMETMKTVKEKPNIKELTKIALKVRLFPRYPNRIANTVGGYWISAHKKGEWWWSEDRSKFFYQVIVP